MNWVYAKIFFPNGRLSPGYIEQYVARYSVTITGPQNLGGSWHTLEPSEDNTSLSILYVDNPRLAICRKASLYDGTLQPVPVYEPPLAPLELPGDRLPVGHTLAGYWPETFMAEIQREPQPEPESFGGVYPVV